MKPGILAWYVAVEITSAPLRRNLLMYHTNELLVTLLTHISAYVDQLRASEAGTGEHLAFLLGKRIIKRVASYFSFGRLID